MRRLITYGTLLGSALLVASCLRPLEPEELLVRSTAANRQLRSARFDVTGRMGGVGEDLRTLRLRDGILQDGGATLSFIVEANDGKEKTSARMVVWHGVELYLKILPSAQAGSGTVSGALGSSWWRIPLSSAPAFVVSPEPALLRLQTEVVKVVEDRGREAVDGRSCRHLFVSLDKDKLMSFLRRVATDREMTFNEQAVLEQLNAAGATGELWIDTKTYLTRRISWTTQSGLTFTASISDPDDAPPVLPPAGARPLPDDIAPAAVFRLFFPGRNASLPFDSLLPSPRSYE